MARDLNQIIIIGRLVRDPEIKYTSTGTPVVKFSIANNAGFGQGNEKKEVVNYFDVNVWGNQAENCNKYLKKGSQVAVDGHLRQNRWTDQATGKTQSKVEIVANTIQFLTPASGQREGVSTQQTPQSNYSNQNTAQTSTQKEQPNFNPNPWNDGSSSNSNEDPFSNGSDITDDDIPF